MKELVPSHCCVGPDRIDNNTQIIIKANIISFEG